MKKIKIKIKGYLRSIQNNQNSQINVIGIKNENKIQYILDNVKHKIEIKEDKIVLIRENNEFKNTLEFIKNKESISYYLLKEKNFLVDIKIKTKKLEYTNDKIKIVYEVIDSQDEFEYVLEMRKMYEYKK